MSEIAMLLDQLMGANRNADKPDAVVTVRQSPLQPATPSKRGTRHATAALLTLRAFPA
jgi:hypothetical protein